MKTPLTLWSSGTRLAPRTGERDWAANIRFVYACAIPISAAARERFLNLLFQLKARISRTHPVQNWSDSEKATAYPISIHGDEGQSKRSRNMLIISWSPLASSKESMYSKFPYCVPWYLLFK